MTTVLFADRDASALGPLASRTVPALLPVQAEPLFEKMLEALGDAGIRAALVVVGPRASEVERRFGKGIRWGIALDYVRREENESGGDVLRRLESRLDGETLVLRADVGAHGALSAFLDAIEGRTEPALAAVAGGKPVGFWRLEPGSIKKAHVPREPAAPDWVLGKEDTPVELPGAALVDSVRSYRAADRAETPAVAERAFVDPKAKLLSGTTVAENATVLEGAKLTETSVLTGSVIPRGVELSGCVVSGNLVLDAETGAVSKLTDRLPAQKRAGGAPGFGSRLAGAIALIFSLPLWPVAFGWGLVANAGKATRDLTLSGCDGADQEGRPRRAPFRTFRFETAVPVLRDLPLLLAVMSGKLALSGVTPLTPAEESALTEDWERVRLEAPPGLLSRARLLVPAAALPDAVRALEAFEARTGIGSLVGPALSSLVTARAWTAQRSWNPDALQEEKS